MVVIERERLRQLGLHVLDALTDACLERSRVGDAVDLAHRAIRLEPLREASHRALIRSYLADGNRIAALTHFRELERLMQEEIGLPAEDETRSLVSRLLDGTRAVGD